MILPIRVYGDPDLRVSAEAVDENSDELQKLIDDMIETMHGAAGVGLAAPQVGRTERIFVVDLAPLAAELEEEGEVAPEGPIVFVNPELVEEDEEESDYEEGCLSIPEIREMVTRPVSLRVRYRDRDLTPQEMHVSGMLARVIQHEYDHLEGILFTDRISAFRRRLLKRRLQSIKEGEVQAEYPLVTPVV